ncbi:hypothetical protein [Leptospira licerasiae]|uniref:hypothetical protein n=1 Tax=Leptospira licerasiae TaxID=447106 RepID=UPI003015E558
MKKLFPKFLFLLFLFCLLNCAVFNRGNTPIVVKVEEHLVPEETGKKILAAPLFIPLGLVAGVLDLFIVHPIIRIPDAFDDTVSLLWTSKGNGYVTNMGFLPISIVLTPIVFTLDLFVRSSFDINGNTDHSRIESKSIPKKSIEEALESGDKEAIITLLNSTLYFWPPELTVRVIERFKEDPKIVHFAVIRIAYTLRGTEKNNLKYETYLTSFLNRNLELDYAIGKCFEELHSEVGASAMASLISSKKVSIKTEEFYIRTIVASIKSKPTLELINLYVNNRQKMNKLVRQLEIRYGGLYEKKYEPEIIPLLNRDSAIDEIISKYFVTVKSIKASQAMSNLLTSGQALKGSVKYYVLAILQIGVEKDIQIILDRFPLELK